MFTKEFYELLMQIIKSWQVIAAAIVIFLYLKIVSYASKSYHPPRAKKIKVKKEKKAAPAAEASGKGGAPASDSNAELGLEEA
jgi:hypothetical protein